MGNKEKASGKFSNFMSKASDFGKKAADGIQKGAKDLSDQTQKAIYEQRMKYYNPLFEEEFFSENFKLPNIIQIVDDAERRNIDVCEGAIGWTKKIKDVEILYLYDEFVKESKISFVPFVKCDATYCVDAFERKKYINVETAFDRTMNEKMAELENIAFSLGAKSCSIEIIESDFEEELSKKRGNANIKESSGNLDSSFFKQKQSRQGGKNISYFEGERLPVSPNLKWFAYDDNIKNLIDMRCSGDYTIKSKSLSFKGSSSVTMSTKSAIAIDAISKIKNGYSVEKRAIKEHSTQMVLEIEF